jgi:hypothetical protein
MEARINNNNEQIDHKTCVSICDAIGERLQQNLRPDTELPPRLRELVDELRRRDNELH